MSADDLPLTSSAEAVSVLSRLRPWR